VTCGSAFHARGEEGMEQTGVGRCGGALTVLYYWRGWVGIYYLSGWSGGGFGGSGTHIEKFRCAGWVAVAVCKSGWP